MLTDDVINKALKNVVQIIEPLPHWKKGRFYNPHLKDDKRSLWNVLLWQIGYYNDPKQITSEPINFSYPQSRTEPTSTSTVQWVNHSTFLVKHNGINILTDPIWAKRASPVKFVGPKRKFQPAISLRNLPQLDYILISHDHYDHLDDKAIRYLIKNHPQAVFCVPIGIKKWLQKRGAQRIIELDWWQEVTIQLPDSEEIKLTSVPAQHFSGRKILGRDKTLWCGWVVEFLASNEESKKLYFVGDTGYNDRDFAKIGDVFKEIDLSIVPIGSYIPKRFMAPVHIGPDEAVKIHIDTCSKVSIASHFGTFRLSEEHHKRPPFDLYKALEKKSISHNNFIVPIPGQTYYW